MNQAEAALQQSPRDMEIHHTLGTIYERHAPLRAGGRRLPNYVNLLPNKDQQREGGLVARGDPVPPVVRSTGAVRERARRRRAGSTPSTSGS